MPAVGDTLLLGPGADSHRVEEIALLNTVLVRWDGARIWSPNTQLSTAQLVNLSRSANKGESFKVGGRAGWACWPERWVGGDLLAVHGQEASAV